MIDACAASRWLNLSKPDGALYAFPGVDTKRLPGFDDHRFALDVLENADVLIVPGNSFNVPYRHHFRVTLLPEPEQIADVFGRIEQRLHVLADAPAAKRHVA